MEEISLTNNGERRVLRDEQGHILSGSAPLNPIGKNAGVKHKRTLILEAFLNTFNEVGGEKGLVKWVNENKLNKREFYKMMLQLMPKELQIEGEGMGETKILIIRPAEKREEQVA